MTIAFYEHPFSSYVQKARRALYEKGRSVRIEDDRWLQACYRRSRNPRPSKIAGIAFSIRAVRVPDCFAPAK